ncbi:30S ribosomal protein S13 [Listeria monocytogenes]|nr:30S ribosomal protein S13 [Listeria monocytogenes]
MFYEPFTNYLLYYYFFLPATVLDGPLRVRALFFVFCPRTGSPRR